MSKDRTPTNPILKETQEQSLLMVDTRARRFQIIEILENSKEPMSAKEIAVEMERLGYTPTSERNFASPRLTELEDMDIVECKTSKICQYTGKPVGLYNLKKREEK